jgi:DNA-binding LytR/AlgR family response regulator
MKQDSLKKRLAIQPDDTSKVKLLNSLALSLNQLLEKIKYKSLVRIHRSYAVNINAIHLFYDQEVEINQQHLPIGRNYKEEFLKRFDFR